MNFDSKVVDCLKEIQTGSNYSFQVNYSYDILYNMMFES